MRQITCSNDDGISAVFGDAFSPWLLEDCTGIYTVDVNVASEENSIIDGSTYFGSTVRARNIVMTLRDRPDADHKADRALLYSLFKPKSTGTLVYTEDDESRMIEYHVEMIDSEGDNRSRQATVSLLCDDPYFSDTYDTVIMMAEWEPLWTFPHEFLDGGEEFGYRAAEKLQTIINEGAVDNIGMTITITALGDVLNPSVTHAEKAETIKVGTPEYPFEMVMGDRLVITTQTGNKHVYLVRENVRTEVNEYLDESSSYIQLSIGSNTIGYDADEGSENMSVEISYRFKYLGV